MAQQAGSRFDVIMVGLGGKGVLMAGELLGRAAMSKFEHVSWFPSYSSAKRGESCECTIVMSDGEITSPVLTQTNVLVVMEPSQLMPFQSRVSKGGLIITETQGLKDKLDRNDVRIMFIPAVAAAVELGDTVVANMVLLGSYIKSTGTIPLEMVEKELEERLGGKPEALRLNKAALRKGMLLCEQQGIPNGGGVKTI